MKKIIMMIIIVCLLSATYAQVDSRERFSVLEEGDELVISYSLSSEFEGWFVIRRQANNPKDFYLVGPGPTKDFKPFSVADIQKATLHYNNSSKGMELRYNALVARVKKNEVLSQDGYGYFAVEILTRDGKTGYGFVDRFSAFGYDPKQDPKVTRENLEFRFRIDDSKGILPAGNIK